MRFRVVLGRGHELMYDYNMALFRGIVDFGARSMRLSVFFLVSGNISGLGHSIQRDLISCRES